jgi:hypothetical protein
VEENQRLRDAIAPLQAAIDEMRAETRLLREAIEDRYPNQPTTNGSSNREDSFVN